MDVYDASKPRSFSISVKRFSREGRRTSIRAYVMAREAAIISKIPLASEGSSNPGVSIRVTALPSRLNSSDSWILATRRSEPAKNG